MEKRIAVSLVRYLNTYPFFYGIERSPVREAMDLSLDVPAVCATKLLTGKADAGLIPAAVFPEIKGGRIISDFCIASDGAVQTVCLLSEVPLEKIRSIYLDAESRTSAEMIRILANHYWKIDAAWLKGEPGYESRLKGETAGLVIGDRSVAWRGQFPYCYDLGKEWKDFTGLPFVYALWAANQSLPEAWVTRLDEALSYGVRHIDDAIRHYRQHEGGVPDGWDIRAYLTRHISYRMSDDMRQSLQLFFSYMKQLPPLNTPKTSEPNLHANR